MDPRLQKLYDFLARPDNRAFNIALQNEYRKANLEPFKGDTSKMVYSLLHNAYFTQSKGDLNDAQVFFEKLANNVSELSSFERFCKFLGKYDIDRPYESLYQGLESQRGWGGKTSALFVKNVYHVHHLPEMIKLRFWDDVPKFSSDDRFYLPVDAVMLNIFPRFIPKLNRFPKINTYLHEHKASQMDVWDDLWFWGFITQEGTGVNRTIKYNKGKYWLLLHTDKTPKVMVDIERRCEEFIGLIPK